MQDARLAKCLEARRESKSVEFKEQFNPGDPKQSLEVLKDIVAIANSGGGTLALGLTNSGDVCGFDVKPVLDFDHAKYCDLIRKYTMQNYADFEVIETQKNGQTIAIFLINPPDFPLVFEKPGTYPVESNKQQTAFAQGTIYFRHGAKSETGTSDDLRKFMEQRIREMRDQLVTGLRKVAVAPRGAQLEIVPAKGAITSGTQGTTPVRISSDPHARNAILIDQDKNFPYRQKDVMSRLKERLPADRCPSTYSLQIINKVYDIAGNEEFSWKPQFSARQYSEAYIEWVAQKILEDENFMQATRTRMHEMNQAANPISPLDSPKPPPQ